jgi:hypothetical protein
MKHIFSLGLPAFILIFLLFGFQTTFISCTKTVTNTDTVTVTKTDTLVKTNTDTVSKDTAITVQLLASRPWQLQYIHSVTDNDTVVYTRGGAYNVDFDSQVITFNSNFTGSVVDIASAFHSTVWSFSPDSVNNELILVVNNQPSLPNQTYTWSNMTYRNDSLLVDQYSNYQGVNSQAEIIWVGVGSGY